MATSTPSLTDAAAYWADENGQVHICESREPIGNELLVWTLCDREVESGTAFAPSRSVEVSCRKCAAADAVLKRRVRAEKPEAVLL